MYIFESKVQVFGYDIIGTESLDNLEKYKNHRRLKVFYNKGVTCCKCGLVGTQIVHSKDRGRNLHVDVCTDDFYPLTIDHILPKSRGGSDKLSNLRPMCAKCNNERGNDYSDISSEEIVVLKSDRRKRKKNKNKLRYIKPVEAQVIKIGDVVYKNTTGEFLGTVIEILPNEKHPDKALSVRLAERFPESLYPLRSVHRK